MSKFTQRNEKCQQYIPLLSFRKTRRTYPEPGAPVETQVFVIPDPGLDTGESMFLLPDPSCYCFFKGEGSNVKSNFSISTPSSLSAAGSTPSAAPSFAFGPLKCCENANCHLSTPADIPPSFVPFSYPPRSFLASALISLLKASGSRTMGVPAKPSFPFPPSQLLSLFYPYIAQQSCRYLRVSPILFVSFFA